MPQNHLGLGEVKGEMWGFYAHCIRRDTGICSELFLSIKYSHRGETHCITRIPVDPSKTLCTTHQYRYILFHLNSTDGNPYEFHLSVKSSQYLFVHYPILPDDCNLDKDVRDKET